MPTHERDDFRLPQNVLPTKYTIILKPDFKTFTFSGEMFVDIDVKSPTKHVVMNSAELNVSNVAIVSDGQVQLALNVVLDKEKETLTIESHETLMPGKARIGLNFEGTLNDNLCGFYRSKYNLPDGTERYMATTQFEAIDARRAFPCFDEPASKAVFELGLVIPEDRVALSNMPIDSELPTYPGFKGVYFKPSPVMSTYLLAFIVGDLEAVEGKTKSGTLVRVWATPDKKKQCEFALEVGIKTLEYFEDYFDIPYPLPKLDLAAIPDFDPGAMENWGLVTFREVALLFDQERSSTAAKQRVASIIAHELAHQWFGNLVTMRWWNDLWLNESFASFMGDKAVNHLFPKWKVWEQFYAHDTAAGLSLDGLKSSHPIEVEIKDPHDIGQIFDAISYSKGASVLRMLENFLGEDAFRRGVSCYLLAHQYANAETQDLWDALGAVSAKPVGEIMATWTKQVGYPVVEVERFNQENLCGLRLSQKRFLYDGTEEDGALWKVPINIRRPHKKKLVHLLLETPKREILIAAPNDAPYIKINSGQTGFFRVKYSPAMLESLYPAIQSLALPAIDRAGLLNDMFALSRACIVPATQFLDMAKHYRDETEYSVWTELAAGLAKTMALLEQEPWNKDLKAFVENVFELLGARIGWDPKPGEDELDPLLRSLALGQLGYCGDEETIEEARQRFGLLCQKPELLNPDLRKVACNISAMYGSTATHDALLRLYRNASLKEEQLCYAQAMGRSKSKELLEKTLAFALSSEVRSENTASVIMSVVDSSIGRELAWKFLKDNWEEIRTRYEHSMFMLGRIMESIVSGFSAEVAKTNVEQFFAEHPVPEANMALRQSLERVDMNIAWLARNRTAVGQWLETRKKTT